MAPRTLLQLPGLESRIIVAHEVEHVRARDSLLLFFAWTGTAMLAWNPVVWWMLPRLPLALEIDCDTRTLRQGVDRLNYGSLLIQVAQRHPAAKLAALSLASRRSLLERRLIAMISPSARTRPVTSVSLALSACAGIVAASEVRIPTDDESRVAENDSGVERRGRRFHRG